MSHATQQLPQPRLCPQRLDWLLIPLAVLPFYAIYLAHFVSPQGAPTGFIQMDMPYYVANGREIFERGNGVAYPNPYDSTDTPPVIYFHWMIWLLGFGVSQLGIDPGVLLLGLGLCGGLAFAWLTLCLVKEVLPSPQFVVPLYLLVMWGGGLLCFGRLVTNIATGAAPFDDLLAWDPFDGKWFLNWGRNVTYPTEACYHALTAASWLSLLRGRWRTSLLFAGLLASTHPWSGLELLCCHGAYWGLRCLTGPHRPQAMVATAASALMLTLFLGYNLVWLDTIPQHQALHETWRIDWSLEQISIALGWAPIGAIALWRLRRDQTSLTPNDIFLLVCFAVAFLLSVHDRLMPPTQPLHFTRGYVWMPLCLLALPLIQSGLMRIHQEWSARQFSVACASVASLVVFDNGVFITAQVNEQLHSSESQFFFEPGEREMLDWIEREQLDGVLICGDIDYSYLSATYTGLRPYLGHEFNTPQAEQRISEINAFFFQASDHAPPWLSNIDYVILEPNHPARPQPPALFCAEKWQLIHENERLQLFERITRASPQVAVIE